MAFGHGERVALGAPGVFRFAFAAGDLVRHDDAEPRRSLAACQDIGSMPSNKGLHRVQHGEELAPRRPGVAIDIGHQVRGIDHNLHLAPFLANRARDSPFDLHDG